MLDSDYVHNLAAVLVASCIDTSNRFQGAIKRGKYQTEESSFQAFPTPSGL